MTRAERIRLAEGAFRRAQRLADLADEHHRIGSGLMQVAARAADAARRIAEGTYVMRTPERPKLSSLLH